MNILLFPGGWNVGSAVKSTYFPCRRPKYGAHCPSGVTLTASNSNFRGFEASCLMCTYPHTYAQLKEQINPSKPISRYTMYEL